MFISEEKKLSAYFFEMIEIGFYFILFMFVPVMIKLVNVRMSVGLLLLLDFGGFQR